MSQKIINQYLVSRYNIYRYQYTVYDTDETAMIKPEMLDSTFIKVLKVLSKNWCCAYCNIMHNVILLKCLLTRTRCDSNYWHCYSRTLMCGSPLGWEFSVLY